MLVAEKEANEIAQWLVTNIKNTPNFNYAFALRNKFEQQPILFTDEISAQEDALFTLFSSEVALDEISLHQVICKHESCFLEITLPELDETQTTIDKLYDYFDSGQYKPNVTSIISAYEPATNTVQLYLNKSPLSFQ